jgi:MFS family permease
VLRCKIAPDNPAPLGDQDGDGNLDAFVANNGPNVVSFYRGGTSVKEVSLNAVTDPEHKTGWRSLPRNVWAVSLTSFFMDISSEMVINILPLFLSNVLGVRTNVIGLIEGIAEATASLLKVFSGWLSDRLRARKWLAVSGYAISALAKPFFYFANAWTTVLVVRWADRVGKGVRTAPRDALVADSIDEGQRGLAFGFHRAADTGGAVIGLLIALGVVWASQSTSLDLGKHTFQVVVLVSLVPAALAVLSLALGARDVSVTTRRERPVISFRGLGRPFLAFMLIVGLFDLGNSSDAFLVLRAQERGLSVLGILGMLITFNLVYTLVSTPAGSLSDRVGRRRVIIGGWLAYAAIYLGFALAGAGWHVWLLYTLYGLYYGLAYGVTKALVADLVPAELRGTAYGTYNAVLGLLDFPASVIAGLLWQGVGSWDGFGPAAPFLFGAAMALGAAVLMMLWKPSPSSTIDSSSPSR